MAIPAMSPTVPPRAESATIIDFWLERAKRDQSPIALQIAALHLLKAMKTNG